jgi:transcriptional regulator with XRE-family HTH domain
MLKELRISKELSLREICKETGYDASNWSKIERGLISPPADEKTLTKWAKVLGLGPKKLREFIDEAKVSQGIIPQDILAQPNAVKCLPAFFRTLRNEKPTKEEIDRLIELIRNA